MKDTGKGREQRKLQVEDGGSEAYLLHRHVEATTTDNITHSENYLKTSRRALPQLMT